VKRLTFDEWAEALYTAPETEKGKWNGLSPGGAAGALRVSRQRVHQLLTQGKLDGLELVDDRGNWGAFLVTDASIQRYLASDRKPGPKAATERKP